MTVLVIAGILSAVAVPSGFNFYVRLQLDEAQNTIYSSIRTARANARSSVGSGRPWSVRIDNDGNVPVVFVEDGLPADPDRCRDIIPCQEITLTNLVDVNVNLPFQRLIYNSRGLRIAESCADDPNPPNPCGLNGTFRVTSPNLQNIERCVTVGDAVIGNVRKGCPG
ncbi:MAG: hypothetical protein HC924_11355 [Synechococcaceae cyanobacterium SM2_3_2]|nr:hypothetical protein [Synechococcaceae cyanobacterium SM2_3_2]